MRESWLSLFSDSSMTLSGSELRSGRFTNTTEFGHQISDIEDRAVSGHDIANDNGWLLEVQLFLLVREKNRFYNLIFSERSKDNCLLKLNSIRNNLSKLMAKMRLVSDINQIAPALMFTATVCYLIGDVKGARFELDEAWDISARGPMRLHMADIHLHRARLFFREEHYPWKSSQDDLATAEKLINECGYHRRDEELADAKQAILGS